MHNSDNCILLLFAEFSSIFCRKRLLFSFCCQHPPCFQGMFPHWSPKWTIFLCEFISAKLKDPSQPHLCYCVQYRIWDRITRRTQEKGQRYNLKISTRKTCHDSFAFILILTSNKRLLRIQLICIFESYKRRSFVCVRAEICA